VSRPSGSSVPPVEDVVKAGHFVLKIIRVVLEYASRAVNSVRKTLGYVKLSVRFGAEPVACEDLFERIQGFDL